VKIPVLYKKNLSALILIAICGTNFNLVAANNLDNNKTKSEVIHTGPTEATANFKASSSLEGIFSYPTSVAALLASLYRHSPFFPSYG